MRRTTYFQVVGNVMVQVHGTLPPHSDEWSAYVKAVRDCLAQGLDLRVFVVTKGGGPSASQRVELNTMLAGRTVRTAVITESIIVRMIISALLLMNPGMKAFEPAGASKAIAYLGVNPRQAREIEQTALELWRSLGEEPVALAVRKTTPSIRP
jgi:hypothetical protein